MKKINILGYTECQLIELFAQFGQKPYKGRQLFKWLYNKQIKSFDQMTDLSKDIRNELSEKYTIEGLRIANIAESSDGTKKILFNLSDNKPLESVLIPDGNGRNTLCISSQVGCALGCKFCATGTMGLIRNLTVGEIVGQLLAINKSFRSNAFSNVVFMGMGEPFNNYENLIEAVKIMISGNGLNISPKKITVSTSGVSPKIKKLADENLKVNLALSLHVATQGKRTRIMPIAETFKLDKLTEAIKYYTRKTDLPVTFEYIIFEGFNDKVEDIKALSKLIHGLKCKINILAYNEVDKLPFKRPSDEKVNWFGRELAKINIAVTIRKSRGQDIDAACGQLAAKVLTGEKNESD